MECKEGEFSANILKGKQQRIRSFESKYKLKNPRQTITATLDLQTWTEGAEQYNNCESVENFSLKSFFFYQL